MVYGKSSSANSSTLARELINTFSYDKSIRPLYKDYAGETVLLEAIQQDLLAERPVLVRGRTTDNTGHAFVCDGMDADGLMHINWGWGGKSDGYFRLSALAPSSQGTGGSSTNKAYTEQVQIYTGIRPNQGGSYIPHLICQNVRFLKSGYARTDTVKFVVDTLRNRGFDTWNGNLRLYIYQNGELYKTRTISTDLHLKLSIRGVLVNQYSPGNSEVLSELRGRYHMFPNIRGGKCTQRWLDKVIHERRSIFEIAPNSGYARDLTKYIRKLEEVIVADMKGEEGSVLW